jgi:hypothetical protein
MNRIKPIISAPTKIVFRILDLFLDFIAKFYSVLVLMMMF